MKNKNKDLKKISPALERWAKMSAYDLTKELDRFGLKYSEAQLMAQNGTLPEDFGLGCKHEG